MSKYFRKSNLFSKQKIVSIPEEVEEDDDRVEEEEEQKNVGPIEKVPEWLQHFWQHGSSIS